MSDTNSTLNLIKTDPTLVDVLEQTKRDVFLNLNCHALATIQSFDPEVQTVTATINYKKTYYRKKADGTYDQQQYDYPLLIDVPVIILSGGNANLTFPIAKGDSCLILFNDRDIDNWMQTGSVKPLSSNRLHALADGVALIGLRSTPDSLDDYDQDRAVIKKGTALVGVGKNDSLVKIANNVTSLNTLLQTLVTDIKTLVTQTALINVSSFGAPPNNAAAITAVNTSLTALGTQISGLLE